MRNLYFQIYHLSHAVQVQSDISARLAHRAIRQYASIYKGQYIGGD